MKIYSAHAFREGTDHRVYSLYRADGPRPELAEHAGDQSCLDRADLLIGAELADGRTRWYHYRYRRLGWSGGKGAREVELSRVSDPEAVIMQQQRDRAAEQMDGHARGWA